MKMKQLTVAMITLLLTASCSEKQQDYPFRNPDLPLEERIDDLLSRLTPEEKIGQMMNVTPAIERLGIPTYDWWNEALHGVARAGRATVFPQAIAMAATFDDNAGQRRGPCQIPPIPERQGVRPLQRSYFLDPEYQYLP